MLQSTPAWIGTTTPTLHPGQSRHARHVSPTSPALKVNPTARRRQQRARWTACSPSQVDKRQGMNGAGPLYGGLVLAQAIPFVLPGHGGIVGDVLYFTTTAACAMTIGCLRGRAESGAVSAAISGRQAVLAPFAASSFLFGSYLLLKYTNVDVGMLLNGLTTFVGGLSVKEAMDPVLHSLLSVFGWEDGMVWKGEEEGNEVSVGGCLSSVVGILVTAGYVMHVEPSFVFSNMIALGICCRVLSLVKAESFLVAAGLLTGLFFYDIFWVFGSEVMVSVATQIDSPGKLLFPREVREGATMSYPYAILGLGDVCVPGIFASIALAMDGGIVKKGGVGPYFSWAMASYIGGLLTCFGVNVWTGVAQPALLYLVPACVGSCLIVASVRGELKQVFQFRVEDDSILR